MRLPRRDWVLIAAAATVLPLAYPPFGLLVPPFVCLVPATLLILRGCEDRRPWRRHLHQGFWYGAVTQAVLLYWLAGALWRYHPTAVGLYALAIVAFGGVTAVLFGVVGRVARASAGRILVALPAGVIALEWIAEHLGPIAFPWHRVALTVTAQPLLVQSADLVGSGGLGYLIVTVNACFALAWWTRGTRRTALLHLEVATAVLLFMSLYGLHRMATVQLDAGVSVAVVQPNVQWDEKWRPEEADQIVARALRLADAAVTDAHPRLVALPETAFPGPLSEHPGWATGASRLAAFSGTTLLVGGMDDAFGRVRPGGPANALFSFAPVIGAGADVVHRKGRLVPLVERPMPSLASGGSAVETGPWVRPGPLGRFGALICFEITFEGLARRLSREGAKVLVTVSNDAWLGRSTGPHQHFAHAVLRAVEGRVAVIRSANTGVSGIVDPLGRVVVRTNPFEETYAVGLVRRTATVPPAVRLGGSAGPLALALLVGLLALASRPVAVGQRPGLRGTTAAKA